MNVEYLGKEVTKPVVKSKPQFPNGFPGVAKWNTPQKSPYMGSDKFKAEADKLRAKGNRALDRSMSESSSLKNTDSSATVSQGFRSENEPQVIKRSDKMFSDNLQKEKVFDFEKHKDTPIVDALKS